jgi:hypothetical protein
MKGILLTLVTLFLSLCVTDTICGDGPGETDKRFLADHQESVHKNPKGLTFVLRLKDDKKTFIQGETIVVELLFSSTLPNTYQLDATTSGEGMRLGSEKWHIDPADGVVDPIYEYFDFEAGVSIDVLSSVLPLTEVPYTITLELNEWLCFDKTGTYRLYATSCRINTEVKDEEGVVKTKWDQPVTSNIITFEITKPDEKWLTETLKNAVAALDAPDKYESKRSAVRTLRFLGTEEAVKEMVRHYGTSDGAYNFSLLMGLLGSPHRGLVIEEMEKSLSAPEQIVDSFYIYILALMRLNRDHPKRPSPNPPDEKDKAALEERQKAFRERIAVRRSIRNEIIVQLSKSVEKKSGKARAICLKTLLEESISVTAAEEKPSLPQELISKLPTMIAASFYDLSLQMQSMCLTYQWRLIKGPAMLPVVRRIYKEVPKEKWDIRSIALRCLYELAPDEGRKYILEEIKLPDSRITVDVLCMLPDETLPELDETLASILENSARSYAPMEHTAQVIERYATKAILQRVDKVYSRIGNNPNGPRPVQEALLAYFLRVDPDLGKKRLAEIVRIRSADDKCYWDVLTNVARLHPCPEVEREAIAALDNANLDVVCDAATMLKEYGSASAEEHLWKRFRKFHEEYRDKKEMLNYQGFARDHPSYKLRRLEFALSNALACGIGWLADKKKLEEIQALCISAQQSQQIGYHIREWSGSIPIRVSLNGVSWGRMTIAQYEFNSIALAKKKIDQFPKGTVFYWSAYFQPSRKDEFEAIFGDLKTYIEKQGMTLNR